MATVIRGNEVISSADGTVTTTSDTTNTSFLNKEFIKRTIFLTIAVAI